MPAHRKNRLICTVATVLCLIANTSWAATRTITCYSDVFAPFVTLEGSDIRGIDVDAIAEAGRRVGIKVNFQILPWVRLERDISLGASSEVECAFAYTMTDQRKAYMEFTTVPVKLTELSIFARRGSFENFRGLEDLKGKTVGIRRGFKMPPVMQTMLDQGNIRLEEVNTDLQNFEKLSRDRIQAILSNREVGLETLEVLGNTDIVALAPSVQVTPTYLVFNKAKGLADLVPLFDKGFKAIVADGTYRKIRARYL
nr:transporter substrate-binding domain-containing protein [uncultured Rhodoferax sp.]